MEHLLPPQSAPSTRRSRCSAPATFYAITGGNDAFWRIEGPAKALGANVVLIPEVEADDIYGQPNRGDLFPWSMTMTLVDGTQKRILTKGGWERLRAHKPPHRFVGLEASFPRHEGVAVFTRPMFPQAVLAQAMRKQGIRTVAETDDNYFAKNSQTLFFRQRNYGEEMRSVHSKAFAQQDACVFSTAWLRSRYYRELRERFGKQQIPEMHVCQNSIDVADWPERVERDGPLRVGFMGSISHLWDVNIAYAAFVTAREMGAKTVMIGYNPGDPEPGVPDTITTEEGTEHVIHNTKSIAHRNRWAAVISEHIPWINPVDYHRAALPLDIGLCPLVSDDFSLSRSDVKAIEYTISGAAVVCTNNPVYNHFWEHEKTCLMANSYVEMAQAVRRLIRDPKLRFDLVTAAQEKVASERGLETLRSEWREVLSG